MSISQRDIVVVEFNLPQGNLSHPAIVLSTNEAIEQEESFVAVVHKISFLYHLKLFNLLIKCIQISLINVSISNPHFLYNLTCIG